MNRQTAWALLTKAERYCVHMITELAGEDVRRMRMIPARSIEEALSNIPAHATGYVMPRGAALLPIESSQLSESPLSK